MEPFACRRTINQEIEVYNDQHFWIFNKDGSPKYPYKENPFNPEQVLHLVKIYDNAKIAATDYTKPEQSTIRKPATEDTNIKI